MGAFIRWVQKTIMSKKTRCPQEERCLELVRLMLDKQATEEDSLYVTKHIEDCYRCYDNYNLENTIREVIKNKVEKIKVSDQIIKEITNKLEL